MADEVASVEDLGHVYDPAFVWDIFGAKLDISDMAKIATFGGIDERKEEIADGASFKPTYEEKEEEREEFFDDMQKDLGKTEFLMTVGDLAYSVYGAMWAY